MTGFSRRRLYLALLGSTALVLATSFAAAAYGLPYASTGGTGEGVYAEFDTVEADHLYHERHVGEVDGCAVVRMTMEDATVEGAEFYREIPAPTEDEPREIALSFEDDRVEIDSLQMLVTGFSTGEIEFDGSGTLGEDPGVLGMSGSAEFHDIQTVIYDFNAESFDHGLEQTEFEPEEDSVENVSC